MSKTCLLHPIHHLMMNNQNPIRKILMGRPPIGIWGMINQLKKKPIKDKKVKGQIWSKWLWWGSQSQLWSCSCLRQGMLIPVISKRKSHKKYHKRIQRKLSSTDSRTLSIMYKKNNTKAQREVQRLIQINYRRVILKKINQENKQSNF